MMDVCQFLRFMQSFFVLDKLLIYPCRYNYRGDHCMYKSVCKDAEVHGISVVHGSRSLFHTEKQPIFKAIYNAFAKVR